MYYKTIKNLFALTLLLTIILFNPEAKAQNDEGFIYGKVTTVDDNTYTGAIRWGKEEAYWFDMFNSSKPKNRNLRYLSDEDRERLEEDDDRWTSHWGNVVSNSKWSWNEKHTHSFACNFGDIKSLKIYGREDVEITLKNGETMELEGGSNDIGAKIKVYDQEIGIIELNWSRIEKVDFMETPKNLENKFGEPLYGTVETDNGDFTGFVQWDHDERVSKDKLDGDTDDGDISIEFGKIKTITREGRGSNVELHSGRDFYLTGSNDVNSENRGIIVNIPGEGRVDIDWRDFRRVTFTTTKNSGPSYGSFATNKKLEGTVTTKTGKKLSGELIYDLDEAYNMEILQGSDEDIEYLIPFRDIKTITPKNYSYTQITLKTGKKITLTDSQDVTDKNDGVLVFVSGDDPTYVAWDDVMEIELK